jgi:hypothetical protein
MQRDPISVRFDGGAGRLLERASRNRGQWVRTRLTDPDMRVRTWAASIGFPGDLLGPDDVSVRGGKGIDAKTAWARSFIRSLQYQHKHSGSRIRLQVEVGRHVPASPQFDPRHPERGGFPPGRAIRIKLGGTPDVKQAPANRRIFLEDGSGGPGPRWSDPSLRWWVS